MVFELQRKESEGDEDAEKGALGIIFQHDKHDPCLQDAPNG